MCSRFIPPLLALLPFQVLGSAVLITNETLELEEAKALGFEVVKVRRSDELVALSVIPPEKDAHGCPLAFIYQQTSDQDGNEVVYTGWDVDGKPSRVANSIVRRSHLLSRVSFVFRCPDTHQVYEIDINRL